MDPGDVGHAVYRAAQMVNIARNRVPPAVRSAQSCGLPGGPCRVNLAHGNFLMYTRPPAAGEFDPVPILTYNSRTTDITEFGYGWTGTSKRSVRADHDNPKDGQIVESGTGSSLGYSNPDANGLYTPAVGVRNALKNNADGTWTETQSDGFMMQYDSTGRLARQESAVGDRWTVITVAHTPPRMIAEAGPAAGFAWDEFFAAHLRNAHTRAAYRLVFAVSSTGWRPRVCPLRRSPLGWCALTSTAIPAAARPGTSTWPPCARFSA